VAIIAMVNQTAEAGAVPINVSYVDDCPKDEELEEEGGELSWDRNQQALVLASFFYGYAVTHVRIASILQRVSYSYRPLLYIMSSQNHLGRARRYPSRQRLGSPDLYVLLAAQYPLQTNPITQPRVRYIDTAMPRDLYVTLC